MNYETRRENEIQIRFFHRIYCFYRMVEAKVAQAIYHNYQNYDDFEEALDDRKIEFTWDFMHEFESD